MWGEKNLKLISNGIASHDDSGPGLVETTAACQTQKRIAGENYDSYWNIKYLLFFLI